MSEVESWDVSTGGTDRLVGNDSPGQPSPFHSADGTQSLSTSGEEPVSKVGCLFWTHLLT